MDINECIEGRRSVRKYKQERIPHSAIELIVKAAAFSPSWKNSQTTRYILIEDAELKSKIAEDCVMGFTYNTNTINRAPSIILVTTVTGRSGYERGGEFTTSKKTHWESFDSGIATQTLCLAAHALGLGTAILGIYDEDKIIEAAGIPKGQGVSAIVAIGYPDESPSMPKRKDLGELLTII